MRIAVISASQIPGRAANSIQVMKVSQALMDLGHEVRLWVPETQSIEGRDDLRGWYGLHCEIPITWIHSYRSLRRYDFAWHGVGRAARWGADLIYCWPLQAAVISARRSIPTLLELHDKPQGIFAPWLMKYYLRSHAPRRILPITQSLEDWLERQYKITLDEPFSIVASMGVDLEQYEALPDPVEARQGLGLKEATTVGYAGHLYEGRGLELIVQLAERNADLQFLWVGGEPGRVAFWRRKLEEIGCWNIKLVGFVPNEQLPGYQAACDYLLMPYQRHISGSSGGDTAQFASPMKAFEYMASGRAILASDLPVLREVLDEEIAILLPPEDVNAWDQALKRLGHDPTLGEGLGQAAKQRALLYSWRSRAERALRDLPYE